MFALFSVQVTKISHDSVTLWVDSIHPDSGPPAPTATFALMLIYDPIINAGYSDFNKYTHIEAAPLARAMDRDDYFNSAWFKANARAFVARVQHDDGELEIRPTHPAWIEHLREGMSWETAAHNMGPGLAAPPRAPAPPESQVQHSDDPAAGFRIGPPHNNNHPGLTHAFIPLHGPRSYVADPVLDDPAAMRAAAKQMLGQPVLIVPKRGPPEVRTIVTLHKDSLFGYSEYPDGGSSGSSYDYADLQSIGRAWLRLTPAKQPAKKSAAKKTTTKKTAAKNSSTKKTPSTKTAAKTTASRKIAAKKTAAKKTTAKKVSTKTPVKTTKTKTSPTKTPAKKPSRARAV